MPPRAVEPEQAGARAAVELEPAVLPRAVALEQAVARAAVEPEPAALPREGEPELAAPTTTVERQTAAAQRAAEPELAAARTVEPELAAAATTGEAGLAAATTVEPELAAAATTGEAGLAAATSMPTAAEPEMASAGEPEMASAASFATAHETERAAERGELVALVQLADQLSGRLQALGGEVASALEAFERVGGEAEARDFIERVERLEADPASKVAEAKVIARAQRTARLLEAATRLAKALGAHDGA